MTCLLSGDNSSTVFRALFPVTQTSEAAQPLISEPHPKPQPPYNVQSLLLGFNNKIDAPGSTIMQIGVMRNSHIDLAASRKKAEKSLK